MIAITCPDCGKALLWHLAHEHRCDKQPQNIRPKRNPIAKPVPQTASSSSPSPSSRRISMPPVSAPGAAPVSAPPVGAQRKAAARARSKLWKQENRPLYNDYMRRYRARQKAQKARQKAPE